MEIRNIDYFLTVAEAGSLRAAAKTLGLTQPALTKAIRRLEDEAGVPFFERRTQGVSLTTFGQSFLRHARALKASMTDARNDIEALRSGTTGRVRIGAGPSWQTRILPLALPIFRRQRQGVQIQIVGGLDHTLKRELRRGALDLVVAAISENHENPDLDGRSLMVDDYRIIADQQHPLHQAAKLDFGELLNFPWILPEPSTFLVRRLEVIMRSHGLAPPRATIETDLVPLKLRLMRGNDYLSFHAVDHLAALNEEQVRPLPFSEAGWRREAGIITRHGVELGSAARHLIEIIERVCRDQAASTPGAMRQAS